jgi:hypothetical protein
MLARIKAFFQQETAGGIVLLLIALDMIFARPGQSRLTPPEDAEAHIKEHEGMFNWRQEAFLKTRLLDVEIIGLTPRSDGIMHNLVDHDVAYGHRAGGGCDNLKI